MKKEIPGIKMKSNDETIEKYASLIIKEFGNILRKYDSEASKSIFDEISSIINGDKPIPNIPVDPALSDMYGMEDYPNAAEYNISIAKKRRDNLIDRVMYNYKVPIFEKKRVKNRVIELLSVNREALNHSTEVKGERDE